MKKEHKDLKMEIQELKQCIQQIYMIGFSPALNNFSSNKKTLFWFKVNAKKPLNDHINFNK